MIRSDDPIAQALADAGVFDEFLEPKVEEESTAGIEEEADPDQPQVARPAARPFSTAGCTSVVRAWVVMPRLLSSSSIFLEVVVLPLPDGPEMRTTGLLDLFSRIMSAAWRILAS